MLGGNTVLYLEDLYKTCTYLTTRRDNMSFHVYLIKRDLYMLMGTYL